MLFNSFEFLIFFTIAFLLYWFVVSKTLKIQNLFIVAASYLFYGWWDYRFLSLIIISSGVDYVIGKTLGKTEEKGHRKKLLWLSLLVNLGILGVFKYYNFFVESFTDLLNSLGFESNPTSLNIILPVGISFYTFQTLSYSIDVYRGKLEPSKNIVAFFAYVAFFPQLVAGPIERAVNLLPQFYVKREFDYAKAVDGCRQILWGFFKKIVIADTCAVYVNDIFSHSAEMSSVVLVFGAILFAFQIYGDFSGYSDIAIGVARLFGFNLTQNFAFPYFSRDIAEFWRRWHISLSTWFRDYLYIPLGGSRAGKLLSVRNIFIIFLVSGFWHGANWTFIFWGLLHALYFLPSFLRKTNRRNLGPIAEYRNLPTLLELCQMLITFSITCLAWIFFRAENIQSGMNYVIDIFNPNRWSFVMERKITELFAWPGFCLLLFIGMMLLAEWINRRNKHGLSLVPRQILLRWPLYIFIVFAIVQYFGSSETFIYFAF